MTLKQHFELILTTSDSIFCYWVYLFYFISDPNTESGRNIFELVCEGLQYLDTRTDFWRQQKPMYARKRDKKLHRDRAASSNKSPPNEYIIKELEKIDEGKLISHILRVRICLAQFTLKMCSTMVLIKIRSWFFCPVLYFFWVKHKTIMHLTDRFLVILFLFSAIWWKVQRQSKESQELSEDNRQLPGWCNQ